jgi:hypothetical protein
MDYLKLRKSITVSRIIKPELAYLDTRGWTFQEKYLSLRTLSFSRTEMYWSCASKIASEGLPMGLIPLNHKSDFDRYIKVDANGSLSTQIDMRQRFRWWYQTMEIYSLRMFTQESDRLIALTGLASKFQTPGDEFLYGLWKSDLAHGLAWRLSSANKETATDTSITSPIPSWSWASCPGKLITYSDNEVTAIDRNESITSTYVSGNTCVSGNGLSVTFFEVLSVDPMPATTNLAASSTHPSLKLRGLLLRIIPAKGCAAYSETVLQANKTFTLFRYAFSSKNGTCKQFLANAFYDEPVTKGVNLYCLPLALLPSSEYKDTKRKTREPFERCSLDELASMQNFLLSMGLPAIPGMTWCAGPLSCRRMKENDGFCCLLLKEIAGVRFRRVGYLELCHDGQSFDGVSPTTLEII